MTSWSSSYMLAAVEWSSLITLLVLAIFSAISSYIQRRRAKQEEDLGRGSPPTSAGKPAAEDPDAMEDWEAELRRLLGQPPARDPVPPAPPAPSAGPATAPLPKSAPPPVRRPAPATLLDEEGPARELPALVDSKSALDRAASLNEQVAERLHRVSGGLGRMGESAAVLGELSHFEQGVRRHLDEGIAQSRNRPAAPVQASLSVPASGLAELLRSRTGAQQAMLASLILGPPKGLERP